MKYLLLLSLLCFNAQAQIHTFQANSKFKLADLTLVDSRPLNKCLTKTLKGAKCIPVDTFQNSKGKFASFRDIAWLMGTANINYSDKVLVFGDNLKKTYALAGIFHLLGQQDVWLMPQNVDSLIDIHPSGVGVQRGFTRMDVFTGRMRDELLVLINELKPLKKANWSVVKSKIGKVDNNKLIAFSKTPLDSISLFVDLKLSGFNQVLVVVDRV